MEEVRMQRMHRLKDICQQYEINMDSVTDLRKLDEYEIVIIADDSGSMRAPLPNNDPFSPPKTRWDELKSTLGILVDIATCLDDNGVDIYFLNREPLRGVSDMDTINVAFAVEPNGYTPLVDTMTKVVAEKLTKESKPMLMIIATDGVSKYS